MPPKEAEPSAWAKLTTPGAEFDRVGLPCPPPRPATARLPTCIPAEPRCVVRMLTLRCAQDELSDVLHWIRQVLALVLGLAYGCIPITGASGNLRSDTHSTASFRAWGTFSVIFCLCNVGDSVQDLIRFVGLRAASSW